MAEQLGDVTIRAAETADAADIARVHIASWREAYTGIVPDDYLARLDQAEREAKWLEILENSERAGRSTWVARTDDQLVGFASFGPARDEDADRRTKEIYAIYLAPSAWGHGVARELIRTVLAEAEDGSSITLWVAASNERARHFYRRHGFAADGTEKLESIGDTELLQVRYRRG